MQIWSANTVKRGSSFGSAIQSRSYASGAYRYGFNGKEEEDDLNGSGNAYDFGARIYDGRLGRWVAVDPLWKITPSYSNYHYVACNPINNIDIAGKYIIPSNEKSQKELVSHFETMFINKNGENKMAALLAPNLGNIQYNTDGTHTVNNGSSISKKDFRKACKGLSSDQKALARGYYKTINSEKKALVQIGLMTDKIDKLGDIRADPKTGKSPFENIKTIGDLVSTRGGGANIIADGSVASAEFDAAIFIATDFSTVNEPVAVLDGNGNAAVLNSKKVFEVSKIQKCFTIDEVIAHEIVGHTLFEAILKSVHADEETIQVSNIVRRIETGQEMRSGWDHNHIRFYTSKMFGKDATSGLTEVVTGQKSEMDLTEIPKDLKK